MMRPRRRAGLLARVLVVFGLGLLATTGACGGPATSAPNAFSPEDAVILLQCEVADAEVWVDDRFVGHVGALKGGIALKPGVHRLEVRHHGYHTFYEQITASPRERQVVDILMAEALP